MFVVVVDLAKPPIRLNPLPVRLESVNDLLSSRTNSLYVSTFAGIVSMGGSVDRELLARDLGFPCQYELTDKMVKRRAEIMNCVANKYRPSQYGSLRSDPYYDSAMSSMFIVFNGKLIRVFRKEGVEFDFEVIDMLFGAI